MTQGGGQQQQGSSSTSSGGSGGELTYTNAPVPTPPSVPANQLTPASQQGSSSSQASSVGGSSTSPSNQISTTGSVSAIPLEPSSDLDLRRRDTININLIWGIQAEDDASNLWKVEKNPDPNTASIGSEYVPRSTIDLSEPTVQAYLLDAVRLARDQPELHVQPDKLTWIEMLHNFAVSADAEFPIRQDLFSGYLQLLKEGNAEFAELIRHDIGTTSPGLSGQFTFASITIKADAVHSEEVSLSETVYSRWTDFAQKLNEDAPPQVPEVVVQSSIFLDAYRIEATIESTVTTWFVANGLCLLVVLLFTQNVALSVMVMGTIILIFFCLGGLLFSIFRLPFGAVEALGVSIFIGLSANYSLHVVHAYHHAKSDVRSEKIKEAVFAVGSPIVASAISTMGASVFLFACRTWVFVELGILICSITAMALLYSMTFLVAWLSVCGPLPFQKNGRRLHRWDLQAFLCFEVPCNTNNNEYNNEDVVETEGQSVVKSYMARTIQMGEESSNDDDELSNDGSASFIEIEDSDEEAGESDDEGSVYSITVVGN
jgi:hypothetical protein